jgi:SAM-dependent methyltransferase
MNIGQIPFECIECGNSSLVYSENVTCRECSSKYEVDDFGVIHFKEESYEYEQTYNSTLKLANKIREMEARSFFDDKNLKMLESSYEEFGVEYCLNSSRFEWTGIEDVRGGTILDLGSGFGGASILSAKRGADTVFAVDGNLGRLRFLAAWADKEEVESIIPIHADALDLSFESDIFDCCIMCGSLEWMGAMENTDSSPTEAQRTVLRNVCDGLSRNGAILIAIENRFALQNFVGHTPHLVEPAFTTILPRRIANVVSKAITGKAYRVYTHSHSGYQTLLNNSGFGDVEFYYPIPDYQEPTVVTSTTEADVLSQSLLRLDLSTWKSVARLALITLGRLGIAHWFMPCYILRGKP